MSSRFLQNKAIYSPKNKKCPHSIPKFSSGGMPIIIDRNYGHTLKSEPCFNEAVTVYKKMLQFFAGVSWLVRYDFPLPCVYFSEIGSYCINQVHTMIHYEILMKPHFYSSIIGDYGSRHFLAICYATSTYLLFRISSPFLVHIYYATYFLLYTKESVQEKK